MTPKAVYIGAQKYIKKNLMRSCMNLHNQFVQQIRKARKTFWAVGYIVSFQTMIKMLIILSTMLSDVNQSVTYFIPPSFLNFCNRKRLLNTNTNMKAQILSLQIDKIIKATINNKMILKRLHIHKHVMFQLKAIVW